MRAIVTRVIMKPILSVYTDEGVLVGEADGTDFVVYQKQFTELPLIIAAQQQLGNADSAIKQVEEASRRATT